VKNERARRPLALVFSDREELRGRGCRVLPRKDYDVLGSAETGDAKSWLKEDTFEVAILAAGAGYSLGDLVETFEDRAIRLVRIG
jgi:hypothetical protein